MFAKTMLLAMVSLSVSSLALPILRREVPQEHSHEKFLTSVRTSLALNNPDGIVDPVFALLGDATAAAGLGKLTDAVCLQQSTADQAFTNAKAAGDVAGMTAALIYRALERNSGSVGAASKPCTSVTAVNPEIAAIQQHQDPASDGAAATNKAIVLELAKQIASVGGDPQDALLSGTFAPGTVGDPTAAGNSCDDANDTEGCIFTQNLLVEDATADEIAAAAGGAAASGAASATDVAAASSAAPAATAVVTDAAAASCPAAVTVTVTSAAAATDVAAVSDVAAAATTAAAATSTAAAGDIGDFGSCTVPQIEFGVGFDNRKETSFEPVDKTSFNHGSAQAIGIIAQFICDTLTNSCGADATAKATCATAQAAVTGADAKTGGQADLFNAAFGITTDFAAVTAIDDQGREVAGTGSGAAVAVSSAAADTAVAATSAAAASTAAAAVATNAAAATTGNLQTFTGALGGLPPAVTPGGRGFEVAGSDDFLNTGAALGRSCDIQHNACANAANSGGAFSVSDCDSQNNDCHAAFA